MWPTSFADGPRGRKPFWYGPGRLERVALELPRTVDQGGRKKASDVAWKGS